MSKNRLPLTIENEVFIRSTEQPTLKTKCKILGARHGEFIIIEDPFVSMGDRLKIPIEGEIICSFFFEGDIYRFLSKTIKKIQEGMTLITYPGRYQTEQVRRHHRIQVKIDARIAFDGSREVHPASIQNISEGGCCLAIPAIVHAAQNMSCTLDFVLPDNQVVSKIIATVRAINFYKIKKTTELGLQFISPPEEIAKVSGFCQYCMFFKV